MVQHYSQLVEHYDFHKDPIKLYFLEKIQFILSRPTTIQVILRNRLTNFTYFRDSTPPSRPKHCKSFELPQRKLEYSAITDSDLQRSADTVKILPTAEEEDDNF